MLSACGFESLQAHHHVGASCISLAPTFFKSQSALIPLLLLSDRDSLRWIRGRLLTGGKTKISGLKLPDTSEQAAYRLLRLFSKVRAHSFLLSDRDSLRWIRGRFLTGYKTKISGMKPLDTSSRTAYRSRRRFLFQSKCHLSLIPLLLLSESNPLHWASIRVGKRKYPKGNRFCFGASFASGKTSAAAGDCTRKNPLMGFLHTFSPSGIYCLITLLLIYISLLPASPFRTSNFFRKKADPP